MDAQTPNTTGDRNSSDIDVLGLEHELTGAVGTCDGFVLEYQGRCISKASALVNIYTALQEVIPNNDELKKPFNQYISIIENHNEFLLAAGKCGHQN